MWYAPLLEIAARGESVENTGGLAGLAAARAAHEGQFFTPTAVVAVLWKLLADVLSPSAHEHAERNRRSIIDTAAGSGRLLWPCTPEEHAVYGLEPEARCCGPLAQAHAAAGFAGQILNCRMEERRLGHQAFDVALINPPFSLHWDTPHVQRFAINARGAYGPHSSAISHWYALWQAYCAAAVVGAIVPRQVANTLLEQQTDAYGTLRLALVAVVHLPAQAFRSAGATVDTSIVVLSRHGCLKDESPRIQDLASCDPETVATLRWKVLPRALGPSSIAGTDISLTEPAIIRPVTRDWRVRIIRHGRHLIPTFRCGAAEAIVRNHILRHPISIRSGKDSAIPAGVAYVGQGALDLEVHLAQPDPEASLADFIASIAALGMETTLDPGILPYLRRRLRRLRRQLIPVRRWAWRPDGGDVESWLKGQARVRAQARSTTLLGGQVVPTGSVIHLVRCAHTPGTAAGGLPLWAWERPDADATAKPAHLPHDQVLRAFTLPDAPAGGWHLIHPGLRVHAPEAWRAAERKARAVGIDRFLTRSYQFEDAVEFIARRGGICAWLMGLGKARLAVALALMGGRHNLILVEARLVDEMITELHTIGLPEDWWQVITCVEDTRSLRRVNILSYSRMKQPLGGRGRGEENDNADISTPEEEERVRGLRKTARFLPVVPAHSGMSKAEIATRLRAWIAERARPARRSHCQTRDCIARRLRHRIHTLVADEAHLLRNQHSEQTRACLQISPKVAFDLSGTPIANYPRDILPLLRHVGGDGTVVQPYGFRHPFLEVQQRTTMDRARRGHEVFADMFCTVEWVTNEWLEDHQGAKREIPRIADVPAFRRLVEPAIVRRVHHEPDVNLPIPVPTITTTTVPLDADHLEHYLAVAEHFKYWYEEQLRARGNTRPNLAILLAKIGAVVHANNHPQDFRGGPSVYHGTWTAKQRLFLDRVCAIAQTGEKSIGFMHAPGLVDRFQAELERRGVEAVALHGGIPIQKRLKALNTRFRNGPAPILLSTYGVGRQGLNLHQANHIIQYSRDWTASAEDQGIFRVLRPQQQRPVHVERMHHEGSIDIYQDQMVAFKNSALCAGLDYGEDDVAAEWLHYETIFSRFIDNIPGLRRNKSKAA
jgi:predicted RNA methylase